MIVWAQNKKPLGGRKIASTAKAAAGESNSNSLQQVVSVGLFLLLCQPYYQQYFTKPFDIAVLFNTAARDSFNEVVRVGHLS